jgi:hypothetical protein
LSFAPKEKNAKNENERRGSLSSSATKAKQPRTTTNQDLGSSSSSAPEEKNQEMMTSLPAHHCHLLQLRKKM